MAKIKEGIEDEWSLTNILGNKDKEEESLTYLSPIMDQGKPFVNFTLSNFQAAKCKYSH